MKNIFPILWKTTTAYMIVSFGVVQLADVVVKQLIVRKSPTWILHP